MPALSRRFADGNTLIIAILITTLFIFMVVGVMTLIVQSSLNIGSLESATRANYGAESGVEMASLWLRDHQPGFQDKASFKLGKPITDVEVEVEARTNRLPKDATIPWNKPLGKLETASIPLFYDSGTRDQIGPNLQIASLLYPANPTPSSFIFSFDATTSPQFQWTVFGFDGSDSESVTGCVDMNTVPPECGGVPSGTQIDENTSGRLNRKDGTIDTTPNTSIRTFLQSHTQSYLVVSNVSPEGKELRWNITYSSNKDCSTPTNCLADDKFVVTASGQSGTYHQTQRAEIPLGEFLPFFHFAIFSPG